MERMGAKISHSQDRVTLTKQKMEQLKTKYKLKRLDMKKELKRYRKHHEASKKMWSEQIRIMKKTLEEQKQTKEKVAANYFERLAEIDNELSLILEDGRCVREEEEEVFVIYVIDRKQKIQHRQIRLFHSVHSQTRLKTSCETNCYR